MDKHPAKSHDSTWAEADRLDTRRSFGLLDKEPDATLDGIARIAAKLCDAPIALVSLVDEERQWFKAAVGLGLRETPREASICAHALREPGLLVVPDTLRDPRFATSPLVTGEPHVRFYAGARLETEDGLPLGTLCVFDRAPRPAGLTREQAETLVTLARSVMSQLDLMRLNKALAESRRRFKTLVDTVPQMIWSAGPDGRHNYFNRRWFEFTGLPDARADSRTWIGMFHPDDRHRAWTRWLHSVRTGEDYECELRLRRRSGDHCWVLARAAPVRDGAGRIEGWFGAATDIDYGKRAEAALQASEEQYRALVEASTAIIWHADPEGLIIGDSSGWEAFCGQGPEQYLGLGWLDAVHPDDRDRLTAAWQDILASRRIGTAEFRVRHVTGEYRWVLAKAVPLLNPDGTVREWIGALTDIHARRQAEEALRASEERLRLAVESTSLGIWDADLRTGERAWTPEAKTILGIPADAPVTRDSFLEQVHPQDRAEVEASFFSPSSPGPLHYSGTYRVLRADTGEERWVAVTGRTLLDPDGLPVRKIGTIQDVTASKRAKMALRESEERLRLALQAGRMVAWEQDLTTNFVTRSENAVQLLGIGSGPLSDDLDRIHPDDRSLREHFRPGGGIRGSDTIEFRYTPPNGQRLWLGLRGEWAGPNRIIGVTFDITDRKDAEAEIWRVANHDALTGLPNRALFQQRLEQALDAAKRNGTSVSLLLIDFDHFKEINDALGHDAGDAFLRETARRLTALVREHDDVARFSGDEFAVILVAPLRLEDASRLAEEMIGKLSEPFSYLGRSIGSKASIGVAAFPDHDATAADLLKDADIALFEAKAQGRSRVVTYRPVLRSAVEQRISLLESLRDALPKGQIVPFYQPKVCLATGRIVGFEVLARWRHPLKGILTPGHFGAAFDDPQLSLTLSERLLTEAVSDLRRWLDTGLDPGRMAFNLSACEFSQPGLTEHVFSILESGRIPAERFEVEVTETVLLSRNTDGISATLNRFHDRGISIALDDFGTGFASLTHLKQFPVNHIKIDRSFVMGLERDAGDEAIVAAIITLGRNLGMQITAEGVETDGQARRLRELGCHNGQGYFFARPVEGSEVPGLLRSRTVECRSSS